MANGKCVNKEQMWELIKDYAFDHWAARHESATDKQWNDLRKSEKALKQFIREHVNG